MHRPSGDNGPAVDHRERCSQGASNLRHIDDIFQTSSSHISLSSWSPAARPAICRPLTCVEGDSVKRGDPEYRATTVTIPGVTIPGHQKGNECRPSVRLFCFQFIHGNSPIGDKKAARLQMRFRELFVTTRWGWVNA